MPAGRAACFRIAYIDVVGLKAANDEHGHAAGDALLQRVVGTVRSQLRSYDSIVRLGGDEFLCVMSGTTIEDARARFDAVQTILGAEPDPCQIKVGFSTLAAGDGTADLVERADSDMPPSHDGAPASARASRLLDHAGGDIRTAARRLARRVLLGPADRTARGARTRDNGPRASTSRPHGGIRTANPARARRAGWGRGPGGGRGSLAELRIRVVGGGGEAGVAARVPLPAHGRVRAARRRAGAPTGMASRSLRLGRTAQACGIPRPRSR